ncbi:MAG: peptide deformylase [Candidatus Saccharimonadales bacterium]
MASRNDIITLPHADLRKKSARVHVITDETHTLIADMTAAALDWEDSRPHEVAVALAAVQIDRLERVVIVRADFDDKTNREFIPLINPEIIKCEGDLVREHEGCLSVDHIYGMVPRYTKVRVRALNVDGQEIRLKAEGFVARVLQHEIDHTNGITFVDHIDQDHDAFYTLNPEGELESLAYDDVAARGIFRQ